VQRKRETETGALQNENGNGNGTPETPRGEAKSMNNVKMCQRCNREIISNLHNEDTDYYSHIRIKYCDTCRKIVEKEQAAERLKRWRASKKKEEKLKDEKISLLEEENEILRKNVQQYQELFNYVAEQIRRGEQAEKGGVSVWKGQS
jgi:ferredoxin